MEGYDIPYTSFGYKTLIEFLRESGEFDLFSTTDGMIVRARVTERSQHIVALVESQNRGKKRANKSSPFIPRFNSNTNQNYRMRTVRAVEVYIFQFESLQI